MTVLNKSEIYTAMWSIEGSVNVFSIFGLLQTVAPPSVQGGVQGYALCTVIG